MELKNPLDQQLVAALEQSEGIAQQMNPEDPREWQRYYQAVRQVSLADWASSTDLSLKFKLAQTAINDIH